ncbi:MAG: transcriptional regulator, family [Chthoniobacteraceae bacterium]|nr:transcriptional regulator, family [Chthoniobacteraceae bacterium]
MRYKNNIGPQVRRRRYALGWSQAILAAKLQMAGLDISRSGVSKIEARLHHVDDRAIMFFAEALRIPIQELFPKRKENSRLSDFMAELEVTNF